MEPMKSVVFSVAALAGFVLMAAGCSVREPEGGDAKGPMTQDQKQAVAEGGPVTPTSGDKMIGGDPQPKADLAALEKDMETAKSAFEKAKDDAAAKKAYVDATVKFATETMMDPDLLPKDKYPKALKLYRAALELDPENSEAKVNSQQIVDIYKSMGRPVPD